MNDVVALSHLNPPELRQQSMPTKKSVSGAPSAFKENMRSVHGVPQITHAKRDRVHTGPICGRQAVVT
jgi:hypothetical protein